MLIVGLLFLCVFLSLSYWQVTAYSHSRKGAIKFKHQIDFNKAPYQILQRQQLNKYTVENTRVLYVNQTIRLGFYLRFKTLLGQLIGGKASVISDSIVESLRYEVMAAIYELAGPNVNYLSNFQYNIVRIGNGVIFAEAYADAIKLYPDSLNIFEFGKSQLVVDRKRPKFAIASMTHILAMLAVIMHLFYVWGSDKLNYVRQNFDAQLQRTLWENIQEPYREKALNYAQYDKMYKQVNQLYQKMPKLSSIKNFDFEVIVIESDKMDAFVLPFGKLIITNKLLMNLKSENALAFIMATELAHLGNGSYINSLGTKIITIYWVNKYLGSNFITKTWMYFYDFSNGRYTDHQEKEAIDYALISLESLYGNVSGAEEVLALFDGVSMGEHYYQRHNYSASKAQYIDEVISSSNFKLGTPIEMDLDLIDETQDQLRQNDVTPSVNRLAMVDLFTRFNHDFNKLLGLLFQDLELLNDVLNFSGDTISDRELAKRINNLSAARDDMTKKSQLIADLINKYDQQVLKLQTTLTNEDSEYLRSTWNKEKQFAVQLESFYFQKNYQILSYQELALKFLKKRMGTYKIEDGKIVFNSDLSTDDYNDIISSLNRLQSLNPPVKEY